MPLRRLSISHGWAQEGFCELGSYLIKKSGEVAQKIDGIKGFMRHYLIRIISGILWLYLMTIQKSLTKGSLNMDNRWIFTQEKVS